MSEKNPSQQAQKAQPKGRRRASASSADVKPGLTRSQPSATTKEASGGARASAGVDAAAGLTYGSVCSGIEAATVAWHPLGWKAAWYAEIDKFPSAVLAHHYPDVANLGDMTKLEDHDGRTPIDLLVGGTPCQSFSVAGLRGGMADARGNLALVFIRLLRRARARWVLWENVPGVFSSAGGADFGSFLGGLVGRELDVPEDGWGNAGILEPSAAEDYGLAWRVLDAQHFGVPQRRRRVFVVGYLGDWRPAAAVLFEREGLPRNLAAGEGAGQGASAPVGGSASGGGPAVVNCEGMQGPPNLSASNLGKQGNNQMPIVLDRAAFNAGENAQFDAKIEESETAPSLVARGPSAVLPPSEPISFSSKEYGGDAGPLAPTLRAGGHDESHANGGVPPAVAYDMRGRGDGKTVNTLCTDHASRPSDYCPVVFKPSHYTRDKDGAPSEVVPPLSADADKGDQDPLVFESRFARNGRGAPDSVCPPLKAQSGETGKGDAAPLVFTENSTRGNVVPTMTSSGDRGRNAINHPCVIQQNSRSEVRQVGGDGQIAGALAAEPGAQQQNYLHTGPSVRRLTPRECERLQGFPDDYTKVPVYLCRHKKTCSARLDQIAAEAEVTTEEDGYIVQDAAADPEDFVEVLLPTSDKTMTCGCAVRVAAAEDCPEGPRYKACGNSMATVVMHWLGRRIDAVDKIVRKIERS